MSASFEEKSVWIQLIGMLAGMGGYFIVAANMLASGITELAAFVPLFIGATVLLVIVLIAGHIIAAIVDRPDQPDERDRMIAWRANANAAWVLGLGTFAAISCLVLSVESVYIAHLLLASMFITHIVAYAFQLMYYRRGVS